MGSFASTCSVSGLPIEYGDKVRFFLLTENPYQDECNGNICEMHGLWFPRTFPLKGQYDDYGGVEKVEAGPARNVWLEGFKHDLVGHKSISFNALLRGLSDGNIRVRELSKIKNDHKNESPGLRVSQAMIREDVWRELLNEKIQDLDGRNWGIDAHREVATKAHKKHAKEFAYWHNHYRREIFKALKDKDQERALSMIVCEDAMIDGQVRKICHETGSGEWMYLDRYSWITGPGRHMRLMMAHGPVPEAFLNTAVEFSLIRIMLMNCRHYWRPSYPCGPQFGEWGAHVDLNEAIARVARRNEFRIRGESED